MPISISEHAEAATGADELRRRLEREAAELGFSGLRVTRAALPPGTQGRLKDFIDAGHHGDMTWLADKIERRGDPSALWPEARSAVMLAMSYAPDHDPMSVLALRSRGAVSVYAQGHDYHDIVKRKLKQLARVLVRAGGGDVKVFVDTAPLMEKPLAAAGGLGWQGKHTNLVSRELGSWFFLGVILTTLELPPDPEEPDHCGRCRRCLDICPTRAFPAPYRLDARRCISYLTIEHKGHIARELRPLIGNRIFGCDDCLAVCPWNKFAAVARETGLLPRPGSASPPLRDLIGLDDRAFRDRFAGTPVKRTGRDRFIRNVLIAAGNSSDASLLAPVVTLLSDGSPLVRAAAVWALSRLASPGRFEAERQRALPLETDTAVREEWLVETWP
jgi:epoxyqueuosine reductase